MDSGRPRAVRGHVVVVFRRGKGDLGPIAGAENHSESAAGFEFRHPVIGVLEIIQPFDSYIHKQ